MATKLYSDTDVQNIANSIRETNNKITNDGYTKIEYLQSTGTQYINTGIVCTNNTGIKIKYSYTAEGSAAISGVFQGTNPRTDTLFISSSSGQTSSTLFAAHRGGIFSTSNSIALNTDYECKINYLNDKKCYFDNELIGTVGENAAYNSSILLFARYNPNSSASAISISSSKIYEVEFTEGDKISHKFIPCYRNSDNELGMYDLIGEAFYTNQGSGEFVGGNYTKYKIGEMSSGITEIGTKILEYAAQLEEV